MKKPSMAVLLRSSICVLSALLLAACFGGDQPQPQPTPQPGVPASPPPATAMPEVSLAPIRLPQDDGPHVVLTEWWYYHGHLHAASGEEYGFMAVIFKRQSQPDVAGYVAHIAVTDPQRKVFQFKEGVTIAAEVGAPGPTFNVQVGAAKLSGGNGRDRIEGATDEYTLQLTLESTKAAIEQGEKGYIAVSSEEYSYYYSRTRMNVVGTLTLRNAPMQVSGAAWMDHQWGPFSLEGDGGWDWFGLQLDDGSDIMVSIIRTNGGQRVITYGSLVHPSGDKLHLDANAIQVRTTGSWKSPNTGGTYPMGWTLILPAQNLNLTLQPVLENQEMVTLASIGRAYWEGQVSITGQSGDKSIKGKGYVELTGYAPMN